MTFEEIKKDLGTLSPSQIKELVYMHKSASIPDDSFIREKINQWFPNDKSLFSLQLAMIYPILCEALYENIITL